MPEAALTNEKLLESFQAALARVVRTDGVDNEQNRIAKLWLEPIRESFIEEWGYDPDEVWNHQNDPGFSLRAVKESIRRATMREAVTDSQFYALTRYGVVKQLIGGYNLAPTVYKEVATIVNSESAEENYAPTYGSDIPEVVDDGEEASESRLAGFTVRLRNERYAKFLAISKTLFDDDQTGQLNMETKAFGGRMAHAEEKAAFIAFFLAGQTSNIGNAGGQIPATNIAGSALGQNNTTTSTGQLSQAKLEDGLSAAGYVTDPLGNLLVVDWNGLVCGWSDRLLAKKIIESMYSPTNPGAGAIGYFMTQNVLKNEFTIHASRFISTQVGVRAGLSSGQPWALIQKQSKALVFQNRSALQVVQETPNAGKSLDRNEFRWLSQRRFGVGPVDFRFAYIGN